MTKIIDVNMSNQMEEDYSDYAFYCIEDRALPDIRDGMKPVHRRIIYSTYQLGIIPEKGYRKCARIVGDVLGKYHPHSDTACYFSMVRMAQDWNMRYMLMDGHGNFGSEDGDNAAAMRYTEIRQSKIFSELVRDINKNTVDFVPNFDGEEQEPTVLPSRFPNLIVNGSEGIAVGFATKIPPHNLNETINGIIYQIDNPNCSIKDLMQYIKSPDFPTYANIINPNDIEKIYANGNGKIILRSNYHFEKEKNKNIIVFTDIPYQVNKAKLVENISIQIKNREVTTMKDDKIIDKKIIKARIPEISEIRDESDRNGMRIVVILKNNTNTKIALSKLFKYTKLQDNYNVNCVALIDGKPVDNISLKKMIQYYINHQKEVLTRRTQFDLDKAQKRLHILEGLKKAINSLDKTIELIRNSKNKANAKEKLINYLSIDEIQANAILELKLQRLTGLEIETIENEYDEILKNVKYLNSILNNEEELLKVLKTELIEIRDKYGDERRTQLIYEDTIQEISQDDLIEDTNYTITLTQQNYIKKIRKYISDKQKVKDGDKIIQINPCNNKDKLLLFTDQGNCFIRNVYDLPECDSPSKSYGEYIPNLLSSYLQKDEKIIYIVTTQDFKDDMMFAFKNGNIARVSLLKYKPKTNRLTPMKAYNTQSKLIDIIYTTQDIDVLFTTSEGVGLIISTDKINTVGSRESKGVKAINLVSDKFEDNEMISCTMNCSLDTNFTLQTEKGKTIEVMLNDICPINENKNMFTHLKKNRGAKGSMIYNCRQKKDRITSFALGLKE